MNPLFQILRFGFKIQGYGTRVIDDLFFKKFERSRLKTDLSLSLILQFNLRLGGYSIWSASFITHHIKKDYLAHEHLTTMMLPRKYSKYTFKTKPGRTQIRL